MNKNTMLETALAYATKGIYVFPCKPQSKAPATQNGFKDASKDEAQIRRWWTENPEYNIGFPTGAQNGIWVLDVDGEEGYQSYSKYRGEIDPLTPQVGTSNGMHLYFTYSADLGLGNSVKSIPGLDVRTDGGYVIAPPSTHSSGKRYLWKGRNQKPTVAPESLVRKLRECPTGARAATQVDEVIPEGCRNTTLFKIACSLVDKGFVEHEIFCLLYSANQLRCQPPLEKEEVAQIAASASRFERGEFKISNRSDGECRMSSVVAEKVEWLWDGRIPLGKLTILDGHPDAGKSNITMDLAARVSTGRAFPDGLVGVVDLVDVPAAVVLMNAEDGLGDTIRPRLEAAGADLDRVIALGEKPDGTLHTFPEDLQMIEECVVRNGAKLLIIDPLMAYLSPTVNSHNDQQVRQALTPLTKMAQRLNVAVLVVRHLKKEETSKAIHRGGGSIGIIGAARAAFVASIDPMDKERRIFAHSKSNLSEKAPSLTYRIITAENGSSKWSHSEFP